MEAYAEDEDVLDMTSRTLYILWYRDCGIICSTTGLSVGFFSSILDTDNSPTWVSLKATELSRAKQGHDISAITGNLTTSLMGL